jgi:hypothetical protein
VLISFQKPQLVDLTNDGQLSATPGFCSFATTAQLHHFPPTRFRLSRSRRNWLGGYGKALLKSKRLLISPAWGDIQFHQILYKIKNWLPSDLSRALDPTTDPDWQARLFPYQCPFEAYPVFYRHIRSSLAATSVVEPGFLVERFDSCTRSRQPWLSLSETYALKY